MYPTAPSPSADPYASGSLDALSFVELLQLELEYKLRIPPQELQLANFRTIENTAAFTGTAGGGTGDRAPIQAPPSAQPEPPQQAFPMNP